jgi:hypothetical protein
VVVEIEQRAPLIPIPRLQFFLNVYHCVEQLIEL